MNAHGFLLALTTVLGVAAVTTVLFQRLKQPVVLGYILAGFLIGPHVPFPLVADPHVVETLSEIGVILLMFSLGLEFSLGKLVSLGPTVAITAVFQTSLMVWLGFVTGRIFGWTTIESLFTGAILSISSTTIIAKAFEEQDIRGGLRELVVGVLIVEDLVAIVMMASLTAIASGAGLSATAMAVTTGKLAFFLVALVAVGLLVVPRGVRAVLRLGRPETVVVGSVGLCFAVALLAQELGYSVALGAFIAGSLVAESGHGKQVEHLVQPVRDIFAAIFFVSVGMVIDPSVLRTHWVAVVVLTLVVTVGKIVGVSLGAFLTGNSVRRSTQAGMSLAQIGEFSFIIAALGMSLKVTGAFLYPVAIAVSAVTTLTTPWLIRASGPVANFVDRKMPRALQTFAALYGSWVERLREPRARPHGPDVRRLVRLLVLDAVLLLFLAIGTAFGGRHLATFLDVRYGLSASAARIVIVGLAFVVGVPLGAGIVRVAQKLGLVLAETALPTAPDGGLDLAAAPRRALVVTLQLAIVLVTGLPLLAVTQPVLGGVTAPLLFLLVLVLLGFGLWRGAANLHGHVRAGAQTIVDALVAQARKGGTESEPDPHAEEAKLARLHGFMPGLGAPTMVTLDASSPALGKSLAALNLRGITGATVLAITRGEQGFVVPTAKEVLRAGDTLALAGTHDAVDAARALLLGLSEI